MSVQVQIRRGTSTQNNAFTGAAGELSFDATNNNLRVHDGSTAGGHVLESSNTVIVQEEGSTVGSSATTLNFAGANITAAGSGGVKTITVAGASGTFSNFAEVFNAYSSAASLALDNASYSMVSITASGNFTFSDSLTSGESILVSYNPATYTTTFPTTAWVGGSVPTLTANDDNLIQFWKFNTTLYGGKIGNL